MPPASSGGCTQLGQQSIKCLVIGHTYKPILLFPLLLHCFLDFSIVRATCNKWSTKFTLVQQQSKALLFQDEFILKNPALHKSIHRQKPRFSLQNSSSTVLLYLSPVTIKSSPLPLMIYSQKPCFALDDTFPKALLLLT